jgi:hypothetical protein
VADTNHVEQVVVDIHAPEAFGTYVVVAPPDVEL